MASPTGGRFIIGTGTSQAVSLAINDGTNPISQSPVAGNFNIEVFTATGATVSLAPGFQDGVLDPGGTIVPSGAGGVLSGTSLTLGTGNYAVTDNTVVGGRAPATIILGSGTQVAVGAGGDTLQGGSGTQHLDAIQQFAGGAETIIGGSGPTTVFGGPGDSVVAGAGNTYIDGTAGKMAIGVGTGGTDSIVGTSSTNTISGAASGPDTISGGSAAVQIQSLGKGDVVNFANQTGNAAINAAVGNVGATLGGGAATVFGGAGDTINLGSVTQYADGGAGQMTITDGSGGVDNVFGSNVAGGADTFVGGAAALGFNPENGGGDLLNLAGSTGNATINAFANGATQLGAVNDTIMAGTGSDSVWGGPGDRIGVGTSSTAGGTHLFDHSTSIAGAAMAFGTNDSVTGTSSTAKVTVTNFATGADSLFYQNETAGTNSSIVASATATTSGPAGSVITLPDGTQMTLIGVSTTQLTALNGASLLFKP